MKIISKFYDYYDSATCHTFCADSEVVYVRNTIKEAYDIYGMMQYLKKNLSFYNPFILVMRPITITIEIIGFCGRLYFPLSYAGSYYYSVEKLIENLEDIADDSTFHINKFIKSLDEPIKIGRKKTTLRKKLIDAYTKICDQIESEDPQKLLDLFLEKGVPCFNIFQTEYYSNGNGKLVLNCNLKDKEFFKVVPPPIAYQEIEMYFNSVLVGEPKHAQITDDIVLAEKAGFDKRISFRHRKDG